MGLAAWAGSNGPAASETRTTTSPATAEDQVKHPLPHLERAVAKKGGASWQLDAPGAYKSARDVAVVEVQKGPLAECRQPPVYKGTA
jgi:hypothetical protein